MEDYSIINGEGTFFREAQKMSLDVLIEFDRVCRENNLQYWLAFGTLIGAVRHKGFIPWDDDIDVMMPSSDYNKFIEIGASQLNPGYFLQTEKNEPQSGVGGGIFKIRKDNTLFLNDFDIFSTNYHRGVFIDVFEAVEYPSLPKPLFKFFCKTQKFYGLFHYNRALTFKNAISYFLFPIAYISFKGLMAMVSVGHKRDRIHTRMERTTYGYPTLKTDIFPLSEIEFEGHNFFAPNNIDTHLRNIYGDYMQIPTKETWKIHAKFICLDLSQCHYNP